MAALCWLCLLMCLAGSSSLHLRAEPSSQEVGRQVGSNVRAAALRTGIEAGEYSGQSEFQTGYADSVSSMEMVLTNPTVSNVLRQANRLGGSLMEKDILCKRRWEAECPDGWKKMGDQCAAPPSYGGACKTMQTFVDKSAAEKQRAAEECKAPWPCDDCTDGRDYSQLCPEGWSDDGGGFCEAPADFVTECATSYNFAGKNIAQKQELAETCGFDWKCSVACEQDYSASCPDAWEEVPFNPGLCLAPVTYSGVCGFSVNTTLMSNEQKGAFAKKCSVLFPCLGASVAAAATAEHLADAMLDGPVGINGQILSVLRMPAIAASKEVSLTTVPRNISKMFLAPSGPLLS